jgi:hypothetical protein
MKGTVYYLLVLQRGRTMKAVAAAVLLLSGVVVAGEIEVGHPIFESLNPFCH